MGLYREIEKNFPRIEKFFTPESLSIFAYTQPRDLEKYNWGLGTMIRLKLLRPKKILYRKFVQEGFVDRDEMTMEIIRAFYKYIHRKER